MHVSPFIQIESAVFSAEQKQNEVKFVLLEFERKKNCSRFKLLILDLGLLGPPRTQITVSSVASYEIQGPVPHVH